jgi:hypothetical protein
MTVIDEGEQVKRLATKPILLAGVNDAGAVNLCYLSASAPASTLSVSFEGAASIPMRYKARLLCGVDDAGNVVPLQL